MREDMYYSLKYLGQRELILQHQKLTPDQKNKLQSNNFLFNYDIKQ